MASEREFNERNIDEFRRNGGKPDAKVEIGSDAPKSVVAHELPRDERDRIFGIVKERAPGFAEYEERTDRVILIFELTPHS
jgi:F420H(2)-dependent quinone reductase